MSTRNDNESITGSFMLSAGPNLKCTSCGGRGFYLLIGVGQFFPGELMCCQCAQRITGQTHAKFSGEMPEGPETIFVDLVAGEYRHDRTYPQFVPPMGL